MYLFNSYHKCVITVLNLHQNLKQWPKKLFNKIKEFNSQLLIIKRILKSLSLLKLMDSHHL
jgi:hypothetical protein